ncbi:MAG: hypothetical protein M1839_001114 [Geoglossum umbratile]|nr:MAG: hypothetical protein M1839_001114 [Geoglossum umbratile]
MQVGLFYGSYLGGKLVFYHDQNGGGAVGAARDGRRLMPDGDDPEEVEQSAPDTSRARPGRARSSNIDTSAYPAPTPNLTIARSTIPRTHTAASANLTPTSAANSNPGVSSFTALNANPIHFGPNLSPSSFTPAVTTPALPAALTNGSNPNLTTNRNPTPPPADDYPMYEVGSYATINNYPPSTSAGTSVATSHTSTYNSVTSNPLPPTYVSPLGSRYDGVQAMAEIFEDVGMDGSSTRIPEDTPISQPPVTFENIDAAAGSNSTSVTIADETLRASPTSDRNSSSVPAPSANSPSNPISDTPWLVPWTPRTTIPTTAASANLAASSSIISRRRQLNPHVVHLCILRAFGVPWRAIARCNSTPIENERALIRFYHLVRETRQPEWICASSRLGMDSFQQVLSQMPQASPPLGFNQIRFICLMRFGLKFDWTWTMKYFRETFPEDTACLATEDDDFLMVRVVMRLANDRARVEGIFEEVGDWLSGDADVPQEVFGWLEEFGEGRTIEMMRQEIMGGLVFEAERPPAPTYLSSFLGFIPTRPAPPVPTQLYGPSSTIQLIGNPRSAIGRRAEFSIVLDLRNVPPGLASLTASPIRRSRVAGRHTISDSTSSSSSRHGSQYLSLGGSASASSSRVPPPPPSSLFMSGALQGTPPQPASSTPIRRQPTRRGTRLPYPSQSTRAADAAAAASASADPPRRQPAVALVEGQYVMVRDPQFPEPDFPPPGMRRGRYAEPDSEEAELRRELLSRVMP